MFRNSELLQDELARACQEKKTPVKKMIRPVDTRWNTMSEVIDRALELRPALDFLLGQTKHKMKKKLTHLRLSPDEWELLEELKPMLRVCSLFCCYVNLTDLFLDLPTCY